MEGFQTVSKLDFGGETNRLTAVYTFPDRVRWHFENYAAVRRSEHQFYYRLGERVHELVSGKPSREITGDARATVLLQMELRRAVFLWPDGFEWKATAAEERSAAVGADSCCMEGPLGSLVATLDGERPRRIEARNLSGAVLEALEVRAWQVVRGRTWPKTLALASGTSTLIETVESIESRIHYLELSFLPPDLRPVRPSKGPGANVLSKDLVAMTYATHELPKDVMWDRAVEAAKEWMRAAAKPLEAFGLEVDPVPTFELSEDGRPRTCLVRLTLAAVDPPAGFVTLPERAGLFLPLADLNALDAGALARLRGAVPEDCEGTTPYVRVHDRPNLPIELVLPLAARE